MLRPPESVENKNDHDLPFNIAGLMQSLAERGAKRLRPTHRCVANHRYRALPRPGYGAGQYQEARGGPRRPVDGGHVAAGDPEQCDDPVFRDMLISLALQWKLAAREEVAKQST